MTRRDRLAATLLALALAILLEVVRGHADWGPSEGVYVLTSRLVVHGGDLYRGLVASQPPWTCRFDAGALAVHDSLDAMRFACGLLTVVAGLLGAEAVWRLTASRPFSSTPGWKVGHTREQMRELVADARRCPPGAAYTGPALVAFLARRRVPADEPDYFIISRARTHAAVYARALADAPRCP